jgi:hypothetical protein
MLYSTLLFLSFCMDYGIAETGIAHGSLPGTTTEVLRVGFPFAEFRVVSNYFLLLDLWRWDLLLECLICSITLRLCTVADNHGRAVSRQLAVDLIPEPPGCGAGLPVHRARSDDGEARWAEEKQGQIRNLFGIFRTLLSVTDWLSDLTNFSCMFRVNNTLIKLCLKFAMCKSLPLGSSSIVKCGRKYIDLVGSLLVHELVEYLSKTVF